MDADGRGLTRDAQAVVNRMHWATYRFTRAQETFDRFRRASRDGRGAGGPAEMDRVAAALSRYDGDTVRMLRRPARRRDREQVA